MPGRAACPSLPADLPLGLAPSLRRGAASPPQPQRAVPVQDSHAGDRSCVTASRRAVMLSTDLHTVVLFLNCRHQHLQSISLTSLSYLVTSGTRAEGLPEAREHGRNVSPETGQPEEAGGQADPACAASGPPARGAHQVALPLPRCVRLTSFLQGMPSFCSRTYFVKVLLALGPLTCLLSSLLLLCSAQQS